MTAISDLGNTLITLSFDTKTNIIEDISRFYDSLSYIRSSKDISILNK